MGRNLYKSLFTEKTGSNTKTQQRKHKYKQSENNDEVHHSSWHLVLEYKQNIIYYHFCSPNLIVYYNLLQNWQKPFTVEMYRNINLSCLLLRSQLGDFTTSEKRRFVSVLWRLMERDMNPNLVQSFFSPRDRVFFRKRQLDRFDRLCSSLVCPTHTPRYVWRVRKDRIYGLHAGDAAQQRVALHGVYTSQPVVRPAVWTQPVIQPVGWTAQMSPAKRRLSGPARR